VLPKVFDVYGFEVIVEVTRYCLIIRKAHLSAIIIYIVSLPRSALYGIPAL
jgi:hypothetical protein